jgi:hypothetical protein
MVSGRYNKESEYDGGRLCLSIPCLEAQNLVLDGQLKKIEVMVVRKMGSAPYPI